MYPSLSDIKELLEAYEAEGKASGKSRLMISAAVAAGKGIIDAGYEVTEMAKYAKILLTTLSVDLFAKPDLTFILSGTWISLM